MITVTDQSTHLLRSLVDQFHRLQVDIRDAMNALDSKAVRQLMEDQDFVARQVVYSIDGILQAHDA